MLLNLREKMTWKYSLKKLWVYVSSEERSLKYWNRLYGSDGEESNKDEEHHEASDEE